MVGRSPPSLSVQLKGVLLGTPCSVVQAHIHYLHSDSFGNQGQPKIRDMQCTTDAYGVTATFKLNNKAMPGWEWTSVPEVAVTARAMLPSTSVISFTLGNGLSFTTFVNTVPIGPNKTGGVRERGRGSERSWPTSLHVSLHLRCMLSTLFVICVAGLVFFLCTAATGLPTNCPVLVPAVNRFALVRNLSWDKSGVFNAGAWDVWARK